MRDIAQSWSLLLVRGIAAVILGILAIVWPGITLLVLVIIFGLYAIIGGISSLVAGLRHRSDSRAWLILSGVLGIIAGIIAFVWPGLTSLALLYVVAFWAIFSGLSEIVGGIQLRKRIQNEWMLIVGGILSLIFGLLLLFFPGAGLLSLVWLLGIFAILYGIAMIILSFTLKKFTKRAGMP
ncbi:HdeD family acid-resistance protein [Nonomuraea pusilla]|uniref:HdeD family acid-resistance protein n=1 Tax=Nonomuraea pusilla TaxID=46177 RepID=UPI003332D240